MKEKLPPKTGLDFEAMMDDIDDQEELKKEAENVRELLGEVKKAASDLETSFETMVIEAFGTDETAASIQEASWKIKWTLDRIDLALERMNETKYTVQLDDKSVLTVNDFHRELISDQKLALEEYKLEQKELFSQYKKDLKSIAAGQGVWLSSKALGLGDHSIRGHLATGWRRRLLLHEGEIHIVLFVRTKENSESSTR